METIKFSSGRGETVSLAQFHSYISEYTANSFVKPYVQNKFQDQAANVMTGEEIEFRVKNYLNS